MPRFRAWHWIATLAIFAILAGLTVIIVDWGKERTPIKPPPPAPCVKETTRHPTTGAEATSCAQDWMCGAGYMLKPPVQATDKNNKTTYACCLEEWYPKWENDTWSCIVDK